MLTIAAGSASATVTVTPVNDTAVESAETVIFTVATGTGYTVGAPASQTGTIADNDTPAGPTFSIADVSVVEGNNGNKSVTITVTRSGSTTGSVGVSYATANGTATAGSDYTAKNGTLTFAAGVTTQTITISIGTDRTNEPNETFFVNLTNPTGGASISDAQGVVTITNDDGAQTAAEAAPAAGEPVAELTQAELDSAATAAKAEWISVRPDADLAAVTFAIADLDGLLLGQTVGSTITIDATAAGWGWSATGMDLHTVLLHEIGHALGLEHADDGLMEETLMAGETRSALAATAPSAGERRSLAPRWIRLGPGAAIAGPRSTSISGLRPRPKASTRARRL